MKIGQKVYYYDGAFPKKAVILKMDEYKGEYLYTIEIIILEEIVKLYSDYFLFENKEKLLDKMEEDLQYIEYNINRIKNGEL